MIRLDRNSSGGGIIAYVKDSIRISQLINIQKKYNNLGIEVMVLESHANLYPRPAIFICTYRPPNCGKIWFENFEMLITELIPLGDLFILGDLNADLLKPRETNAQYLINI